MTTWKWTRMRYWAVDLSVVITNFNTVHDKDDVASSVNPPSLHRRQIDSPIRPRPHTDPAGR